MGRRKSTRIFDPGFGQFFREARVRKYPHLSGRQFAKLLGISSPYLFDIENGNVPPPTREIVEQMADLLDVDRMVLLTIAGYGKEAVRLVSPFENVKLGRVIIPKLMFSILSDVLAEEGTNLTDDNLESVLCGFLTLKKYEHVRQEVARRVAHAAKEKKL